jgi:hypothetical protein
MPRLPRHEQRLGVVGVVANHPLRFLSRATFGPWRLTSANVASISVTSAGEVLSSRIPSGRPPAVSQYHPLRSVAPLGLSNCRAPLVAGAKLSSRNISSRYGRPSRSSAPSSGRHTSSHTSCFSHCFNHRQQVVGDGYLPGRKRHADPVCSTHKMPSRQSRLGSPRTASPLLAPLWLRQQRPDQLHFASVNNLNRLLLMQQAHQTTPHTQKYTA